MTAPCSQRHADVPTTAWAMLAPATAGAGCARAVRVVYRQLVVGRRDSRRVRITHGPAADAACIHLTGGPLTPGRTTIPASTPPGVGAFIALDCKDSRLAGPENPRRQQPPAPRPPRGSRNHQLTAPRGTPSPPVPASGSLIHAQFPGAAARSCPGMPERSQRQGRAAGPPAGCPDAGEHRRALAQQARRSACLSALSDTERDERGQTD